MENKTEITLSPPPRLMSSIISGFNSVTNNIYLILFPIALDMLIWFGPHLRIKSILMPYLNELIRSMSNINMSDFKEVMSMTEELWLTTLEHFNLVIALRTYPVGIPSLLSSEGTLFTPLGNAPIHEMTSLTNAFTLWIGFAFIGIILGSYYFRMVAIHSNINIDHNQQEIDISASIEFSWQVMQTIGLTMMLLIIMVIILLPSSFILSLFAMINPILAQIAVLVFTFFIIWLIIPLLFSPHGIFTYRHNFLKSLLISTRLVRFTLPLTSLFLLIMAVLSQGLNALWRLAPETSWMRFVGVAGHAFISTGLLASSFVYYRSGILWIQDNMQKYNKKQEANTP